MRFSFSIGVMLIGATVFSEGGSGQKIQIQKRTYMSRQTAYQDKKSSDQRAQYLARNRANLIEEVKSALRFVKNTEQAQELQLRLANLYIEEFKFQNGKGTDTKALLQRAQGILKDLARTPQKRTDEILFQLAQSYLELGQNELAYSTFSQLIKSYLQSPFLEESYLQLADAAFEQGQFAKSLTYFEKLTSNPNSPLWLYAHYKSGWASYNLNQLGAALKHFKTIVEREDSEGFTQQSLALKKEAIRDLCLPLAELKKYEEGTQFYMDQGEAFHRPGLECLAQLAQERGDALQAISLYRALITLDSQHKKNPSYSLSIVEIHRKQDKPAEAFAALEEALGTYLGDSTWKEIFSSDTSFFEELRSQHEAVTRVIGLESHSTAQKTKSIPLYQQARAFYELYLKYFSQTKEAPQIEFNLAEIQYKEKHFSAATQTYTNVFNNSHAPTKLRQESLEYALLSSSQQVNLERKKAGLSELSSKTHDKRNGTQDDSITSFLESEETLLNLADKYVEAFPKDPKTPQFLFQASYLRYLHHINKPAYAGFWQIIQNHPKTETAQFSSILLLDILNQKQDFTNMIAACQKLKKIPELQDKKFSAEIGDVLRKSELKQIYLKEQAGDYQGAATSYLGYIDKYGSEDSALEEKALFNASVCLKKANLTSESLRRQEQFLRKYPSSALRKEMLLQVAKSFEAMADYGQAAHYFSIFQREYPNHAQSPESLRLAGLYYWGSGNPEMSETAMNRLIQSYPKFREVTEKDLMDLYSSERWFNKQFDYLVKSRTVKGISFSTYLDLTLQLADLQESKFQKPSPALWSEAEALVDKYRAVIQAGPQGPELIGRVLLRQALRKEAEFRNIRLKLPQAALEKSLSLKIKLLKELEKEFSQIASLGGDSGLASIYHTAQAYLNFSEDIDAAPVPTELSGEQIDMYRSELAKQMIIPFKEKAATFAKQCLEKGQEARLFSIWGSKCHQLASHLNPELYPKVATYALPPYLLSVGQAGDHVFLSTPLFKEALKDKTFEGLEREIRMVSLQPLAESRKQWASELSRDEKLETTAQYAAYFNSVRLTRPSDAIYKIKNHLKTKSQDPVFHQLLAMAYLDNGDLDRAKISWLSLLARGVQDPGIYNNLGVVEALRGNRQSALNLFEEAREKGNLEAAINQGFMALSFGNGFLAKSLFEKSLDSTHSSLARMGLAIAKLQNDDLENGKDDLEDLQKEFPNHPLVHAQRLALQNSGSSRRELASEHTQPERSIERIERREIEERTVIQNIYDQSSLPDLE